MSKLGYFAFKGSLLESFSIWIIVIAILGLVCFAYGYIEPYWLSISHVKLITKKFHSGSKPIKIAHFSDLHCEAYTRLEYKLVHHLEIEKPDLIVFTGDTINSPEGLKVARDLFSNVSKIAPTFAVKGNWDCWRWQELNVFDGTNVIELESDSMKLLINGVSLWITGVSAKQASKISKLLQKVPQEDFSILLYHYPDEIENVAGQVDLYCAGHTHGGQIALPFYGALITHSKFDKKYEAGLYNVKNTWLYVSRGIGMEGGNAPRVRFCSKPELTFIEVHSS